MKPKKNKLAVRPLQRAYQPKYPAYWEENPLKHPDAYPYPFSKRMLQTLNATGFAGALLLSTLTGCDTPQPISQSGGSRSLKGNPFPVAATNLPYTPVSFGTGLPSRLKREDAIDYINRAFEKEGLAMAYDTLVEINGVRIPANAYNVKYQLGYVWIDYLNHGRGMAKSSNWRTPRPSGQREVEQHYRDRAATHWESYQNDPEKYVDNQIHGGQRAYAQAFRDALQKEMPRLEGQRGQRRFFEEQYIQYLLNANVSSTRQKLEKVAASLERIVQQEGDPLAALALTDRFISTVWRYTRSNKVGENFHKQLLSELDAINSTQNRKRWRDHLEALLSLLNTVPHTFVNANDPVFEKLHLILQEHKWRMWKRQEAALEDMVDARLVDYHEMERIEILAKNGEAYVAPISQLDHRTIVRRGWGYAAPDLLQRQLELHRQLKEAETEEIRDSLNQSIRTLKQQQQELREMRSDSIHQAALEELEMEVRRYIQWARTQQGG